MSEWDEKSLLNPSNGGVRSFRTPRLHNIGTFNSGNVALPPCSQHRVVIIYDKQANNAAPLNTDVFQADAITAPLRLAASDRFVVIMDEMTDSSQSSALNICDKRYTKCNLETIFSGTGATISSIVSGSLYMYIANNGGSITGTVTSVDMFVRIRYTDI